MTDDRWAAIEQVYYSALEREPHRRDAFLGEVCDGDAALRREIESLLAADRQAGGFLSEPAVQVTAREMADGLAALEPGAHLSHYEILSRIGTGGMGEVYLARDTRLGREVAVKILPPDKVGSPEHRQRLLREARAASLLNHPNIVIIHDIAEAGGIDFMVMEYIRGRSLRQILSERRLDSTELLRWAIQVCDALAKAHASGVVHRDLNPRNIMITEDGLVKVVDFGLAKVSYPDPAGTNDATLTAGAILGTPGYMSPEQAVGDDVDARSDVFSFGVVLYEMIAGVAPFRDESKARAISKVLTGQPPPLTEAPAGLGRLVQNCLHKDRARRYPNCTFVAGDLRRCTAIQDSSDTRDSESPVSPAIPPDLLRASRRLRPPILLAGTAVLAAAVIPWYARQDGRPPAALDAIPIATEPGLKSQPTFSPDGNHVAFRWNSQRQDNFDIYVKLIGTSSPLRLTTHPASDYSPAWSPDGRHIAFLRETHSALSAVILIPPLGGPERKLAEVYGAGSLCWSPDGKWLYLEDRADYHDPEAIFALSVDTGEKRRLTNPPRRGDRDPAISPDGHTLAFVRFPSSSYGDIYVLRINGGTAVAEARRISTDHRIVSRPAWTPDGQLIVVNGPVGNFHLSRLSLDGNSPPARLISDEVADDPTVSLDHRRLAYTKITKDTNIWRVDASRNEVARPVEFISSSRLDFNPQYSPDGTRLVFSSNRTGAFEVWTANNDGSGLLQLTSFGGAQVGSPRWSPDQRRIAFDHSTGAESRVYTVSAEGGEPRIVPNTGFAAVPNWSRDGRWIYYASNRTGIFEIWKISEQQGVPVQVTRNGGYVAFESWDGRDLYYSKTDGPAMIWKMSLAGAGHESPAISEPVPYRAWGVTRDGLWFIPAPAGEGAVLKFLSFDGKVRTIAKVSKPVSWGLTVSPDQRTVLYSQIDQNGSDLMLVDRFH